MHVQTGTRFAGITLPNSDEEKRQIILKNEGKFALVNQFGIYTLIRLDYSGKNPDCYHSTYSEGDFRFKNLSGLLIERLI